MTIDQANADVARMLPLIPEAFPHAAGFTRKMFDDVKLGPNVQPLSDDLIGDVGTLLWVLFGTVGMVLLIACANVANLCPRPRRGAAAGVRRSAPRSAPAAADRAASCSRRASLLALAGGVARTRAGARRHRAARRLAPDGLPRLDEIAHRSAWSCSSRSAISLVAGLLFGILPVLQLRRAAACIGAQGRRTLFERRPRAPPRAQRARRRRDRPRARAARRLGADGSHASRRCARSTRASSNPEEVLTLRISIPEALVADTEQAIRMHEQIVGSLDRDCRRQRPSAFTSRSPMDGYDSNDPIFAEDFHARRSKLPPLRRFKWIGAGLLRRRWAIPLVAGRDVDVGRRLQQARRSCSSARTWRASSGTPRRRVGRRIRQSPSDPWREIVGVVGDEHDNGVAQPATPIVYWPLIIERLLGRSVFTQRTLAYAIRSDRMRSPTFCTRCSRPCGR